MKANFQKYKSIFNPTPVWGDVYHPPTEKWQLLLKIVILKSDFPYISMTTRTTNVVRNAGCAHSRYTRKFFLMN